MNFETNGDSDINNLKNHSRVNKTKGKKGVVLFWAWSISLYVSLLSVCLVKVI